MKDLSAYLTTLAFYSRANKKIILLRIWELNILLFIIVYYQAQLAQLESELALFQTNPPLPRKSWMVSLNRIWIKPYCATYVSFLKYEYPFFRTIRSQICPLGLLHEGVIDLSLLLCHNIAMLMTRHHYSINGWGKVEGSQEEVLLDGHWSQVWGLPRVQLKYSVLYLSNDTHIVQTTPFKRHCIYKEEQEDRIREEVRMMVMEVTEGHQNEISLKRAHLIQHISKLNHLVQKLKK